MASIQQFLPRSLSALRDCFTETRKVAVQAVKQSKKQIWQELDKSWSQNMERLIKEESNLTEVEVAQAVRSLNAEEQSFGSPACVKWHGVQVDTMPFANGCYQPKNECSTYRGISLLSLPGKIYAKRLQKRCRKI
ncbi:unnamed protein product [Clavelina lepadiformis]|uniref:Uncharacterized protein n=1 Tax=Clavelina lepadiformis TaxID=159417 RepID=A0ABP0FB72_CLALP